MTNENETTKKPRKPIYTLAKWAEENGYGDALLPLIGDDKDKIMPAVRAAERAKELRANADAWLEKAREANSAAETLTEDARILDRIKARLDAIKAAAQGK